jgi:hypothetical protein
MVGGEENDKIFKHLRELEQQEAQLVGQGEKLSLDAIADQLALHYPNVVILVAQKEQEADETLMSYVWRGGYYPARGMVERLRDIMKQRTDEDEDC